LSHARFRARHCPLSHLFIQRHGDEAIAKARERVEEMRGKCDYDGADEVLRIIVAIGEDNVIRAARMHEAHRDSLGRAGLPVSSTNSTGSTMSNLSESQFVERLRERAPLWRISPDGTVTADDPWRFVDYAGKPITFLTKRRLLGGTRIKRTRSSISWRRWASGRAVTPGRDRHPHAADQQSNAEQYS
jgi:hypothetical protein